MLYHDGEKNLRHVDSRYGLDLKTQVFDKTGGHENDEGCHNRRDHDDKQRSRGDEGTGGRLGGRRRRHGVVLSGLKDEGRRDERQRRSLPECSSY